LFSAIFKLGNDEYLQGTYYSTSVNDSSSGCGKGSIFTPGNRIRFSKRTISGKKEKNFLHVKMKMFRRKNQQLLAHAATVKPRTPVKNRRI
jgi:hypothetical protein